MSAMCNRPAIAIAVALAFGGCVTGNAIIKVKPPSVPVLVVTTVADLLVVGGVTAFAIDGFTGGAVAASTLAITAVDVAVGCLFGACKPLNP